MNHLNKEGFSLRKRIAIKLMAAGLRYPITLTWLSCIFEMTKKFDVSAAAENKTLKAFSFTSLNTAELLHCI